MFLRVPPQILRSIKYVWKCHQMVYTLHFLALVFLCGTQLYMDKISEHTLVDIIFAIDIFLAVCPFYLYTDLQSIVWALILQEMRNGNMMFFLVPMLLTLYYAVLNMYMAFGFYRHAFTICGFGYAYSAFLQGTLGGCITGIVATLLGIAFAFLSLLNFILFHQVNCVYRNLCDDLHRRRG